jgi:two-component system chemotaxis response regulator CheB
MVLKRILSRESDMEVLGVASDPFEARDLIIKEKPDVITLDIEMPRMDGITFLRRLMSYSPIPVIMISSYTGRNSIQTMEALEAGAVDFITKPARNIEKDLKSLQNEIITKIRNASKAQVKPLLLRRNTSIKPAKSLYAISNKLVVIGASIGGPQAIQKFLCAISFQPPCIVIAQHMPSQYTNAFAERLNSLLPFEVREARDMEQVDQGRVLIVPGGKHMQVECYGTGYVLRFVKENMTQYPLINISKSIDVLFHSVAENVGRNAVGIVLTGMGSDGVEGLAAMKKAGAYTIAQNEESCVVFGIPGEAIKRGIVDAVGSPEDIPNILLNNFK